MQRDENLIFLMDKASAIAGNDYRLAKAIGASPQMVHDWRTGKSCPPEQQALMAAVAGLDPVQTLARATVAKFEGTAKGDRLMKVLGKASLLTGAAIGSAGASAATIFSTIPASSSAVWNAIAALYTMYITPNRRIQQTLCQPNSG